MKILFLDDNQDRINHFIQHASKHDLTIVNTAPQAIEAIKNNNFDILFLDHDLDEDLHEDINGTGMDVVRHIIIEELKFPLIIIHSWNHPAAVFMLFKLNQNNIEQLVFRCPFQHKSNWIQACILFLRE